MTISAHRRFFRPTWAEVDLGSLKRNLRRLRARAGARRKLMFVVKGNAYGHGATACAKAAQAARLADWLGVSSVEEGIALREAGVRLPVLVLGSLYPFESFLAAAQYNLTPTVASFESAEALVRVARRLGRSVRCHLKVETGMGRIGMSRGRAAHVAGYLAVRREVDVEGIYTHLACAQDGAFTRRQLALFREALAAARLAGVRPRLVHAAASAAALHYAGARFDMIRPGIAIYGCVPGFAPVLSLKTKVVFLKTVPKGAAVSYGATWRARQPTRVATIPVGYADGYSRGLSNKGQALLHGRRVPVIGHVTMDMTMLDVSGVPQARVGDDCVLIGRQGREEITAAEVANWLATIPYEVATGISSRVPRVYLP